MSKSKLHVVSPEDAVLPRPALNIVSNPALPLVGVTIEDVKYVLKYDFNALAKAEEMTGINLFGTFDFRTLSMAKFRAMLWSAMQTYHPKATLDQAGSLINQNTLAYLTVALVEAWNGSRPEIVEDTEEAKGNELAEAVADAPVLEFKNERDASN